MGLSAGYVLCLTVLSVITAEEFPCTPDIIPELPKRGFCIDEEDQEILCSTGWTSISKDCVGLESSWCCYDAEVRQAAAGGFSAQPSTAETPAKPSNLSWTRVLSSLYSPKPQQPPNIVFILADDLGFADIGYQQGNLQTPTPNIDKLAYEGVILNRHYANPSCSPTRSALLSGYQIHRTGMQQSIFQGAPWGLPTNYTLLPQYLKGFNYSTNLLGKWHIGAHKREFLPAARGFDYSLGFMEGTVNLFNYTTGAPGFNTSGRNLYENGYQVQLNCTNNHYLPHMLTEKFEQIVHNADPAKPFYVQFSTPLPHGNSQFDGVGGEYCGIQNTMPEYNQRPVVSLLNGVNGAHIPDRQRQLAQIQALDDQVRRVRAALEDKGVLNNTIIIFAGDNGGATRIQGGGDTASPAWPPYASTWPLKMFKGSVFDGGVRTHSFIWSPLLKRRGLISNQLFHVTDWLPTLYEAVGGDTNDLGDIDGVSHWKSLVQGTGQSPRTELVNNIDAVFNQSAMIYADNSTGETVLWKLIRGNIAGGELGLNNFTGWERTIGTSATNEMVVPTPASVVCSRNASVQWGVGQTPCKPWHADCLFDLTNDPCELNNLAADPSQQSLLRTVQARLAYHATEAVTPLYATNPVDPASNPRNWDGWWVPWQDTVPVLQSPPCVSFNPASAF